MLEYLTEFSYTILWILFITLSYVYFFLLYKSFFYLIICYVSFNLKTFIIINNFNTKGYFFI